MPGPAGTSKSVLSSRAATILRRVPLLRLAQRAAAAPCLSAFPTTPVALARPAPVSFAAAAAAAVRPTARVRGTFRKPGRQLAAMGSSHNGGDAATTEEDVVAEEMQREPTVEDLCPEGSYARLTAEVDAINRRLNSPTDQERAEDNEAALHVVSVSGPVQLTQKCVNGRMVLLSRDQVAAKLGPWIVDVVLQGKGESYYSGHMKARLHFDSDYPIRPPKVQFRTNIHHLFLTDSNAPYPKFFYHPKMMPFHPERGYTLQAVLDAMLAFVDGNAMLDCMPFEDAVKKDLKQEFESIGEANEARLDIMRQYAPMRKHPQLFDTDAGWQLEWMDSEFADAICKQNEDDRSAALMSIMRKETEGVYSFPFVKQEFCQMLIEEVDNYQGCGLPIRRPNSMNNYGLILNEIGLEPMIDLLQEKYLQPVARLLFPKEGGQLDKHHTFIVQYKPDQDLGLDMHTDDSDVTFNICLGKEFEGAGLTVCGMITSDVHRQFSTSYKHVKGRALVHLGRHRHGADDIISGERMNLIVWNHSATFRSSTSSVVA
mmetsp:Transcript_1107/g.3887  ORF Transcript_1107/g.3887 Transcript_1107/m.3887 type:complete len:542 (+) Transcript_1107:66-1691(+)